MREGQSYALLKLLVYAIDEQDDKMLRDVIVKARELTKERAKECRSCGNIHPASSFTSPRGYVCFDCRMKRYEENLRGLREMKRRMKVCARCEVEKVITDFQSAHKHVCLECQDIVERERRDRLREYNTAYQRERRERMKRNSRRNLTPGQDKRI